jgi:hypothetical protein
MLLAIALAAGVRLRPGDIILADHKVNAKPKGLVEV